MTKIRINQGNDYPLTFQFWNEDTAEAIPVSNYADYHIYVYSDPKRKQAALIYYKTPVAGEEQIKVTDDANGLFTAVIPREWTRKTAQGSYYVEVRYQTVAGSEFENLKFVDGQDLSDVLEIVIEQSTRPKAMTV